MRIMNQNLLMALMKDFINFFELMDSNFLRATVFLMQEID